ncbi:hypothetical protein FI667_g8904, partial [Globisporangium splendens]
MEKNAESKPRQRAIIYAGSTRRRHRDDGDDIGNDSSEFHRSATSNAQQQQRSEQRRAISTTAAQARNLAKSLLDGDRAPLLDERMRPFSTAGFQVPKISQLSPTKELMRRKNSSKVPGNLRPDANNVESDKLAKATEMPKYLKQQTHFQVKSHLLKKRRTNHAGAPVILDRIDCKSRLREKIWKDLNRFGLWCLPESADGSQEAMLSVDETVDSIMTQWDETDGSRVSTAVADLSRGSGRTTKASQQPTRIESSRSHTPSPTPAAAIDQQDSADDSEDTFLTALPANSKPNSNQTASRDEMYSATEEDEGVPQEDGEDLSGSDDKVSKEVQPPGMKRRQRLKELHYFVEKQLQKRLYKSWDTIEIAFTSSGDLTVSQIAKFLQLSDVQLSAADAAKVQSILEKHAQDVQAAQTAEQLSAEFADGESISESGQSIVHAISKPSKPTALSYEAFRNISHTKDTQEAVKWKREFDREKVRQRREKEICEKELAALEEKAASSAAAAAADDIVNRSRFQYTSEYMRRTDKLSVKLVESALLQKYSRNGHFEAIEVVPAAYIYHDFVADCIKKSVQDYWKRCESDLWPERQMIFRFRLKKQVFQEWRRFTKHAEVLRRFAMRKFVAWKYFARKLHEHYEFIRISFWPFYVWKRHLQQQIIARGKSAFLKSVVLTYIQLRHFRALKVRYQRKQWIKRRIAWLVKKKSNQALLSCWTAWKARIQSRVTIHRLWKSRGHALQRLHKLYMVKVSFLLWRYFAILKKDLERRRFKCLGDFKAKSKACHGQHQANVDGCSQASRKPHGVSWYPSVTSSSGQPLAASSLVPRTLVKTGKMASFQEIDLSIPSEQIDGSVSDDGEVDVELDGDGESNDRSFFSMSNSGASNVPSLARIMETELGQNIKRKSRLYDLCLALYLKCREQDRRKMVENVVIFRRIGRRFLFSLKKQVDHGKKNRLASDLGGFRVLHQRFRQWTIGTLFKDRLANRDDKTEAFIEEDDLPGDASGHAILHWRHDREWRQIGIEQDPIRAQQLRQDLLNILTNDSRRTDEICEREMTLKRKQQSEDSFLRKETSATSKVKSAQMLQSQQILRTRGHRLHDVLDRVFDALLQQKMRCQLRSSFRSLRAVVMMSANFSFKLQSDHPQQQQKGGSGPQRNGGDEVSLCDRQFSYFLQVRTCDVLTAMKRAHRLALRAQRMTFLPSSLTRTRILMGIMRWFFNSLSRGLVHNTTREEEGKLILQDGMNQRTSGEKSLQEGLRAMEFVDSFRDDDHQLNTATLGAKKVAELREMLGQAQHKIALGRKMIDDGQAAILMGRSILPHLPMTKRMMTAIRKVYKVVQTKDYIDQMDPDVRAILLAGDGSTQQDASLSTGIDVD